ncbi:unnamed protein product [Cylicocyclus nassatus]|uniref:acid phosphatase n=1 Tax=Cylicocyclus nassatus TaxID=53992 RepID=A0AA36H911_CYLNA|nr:unnamed protein product [Cylicocyclus nassatus]
MTPLLILFSTFSTVATFAIDGMELKLVQVVWRHGDRSPTLTYKTDPIQEDDWTFGGGGWGQLSPIGMKQHFEFGKQLRKHYVDSGFLSKTYDSKEIYVRSSDYNRTIISAMANLVGMYSYNNSASIKDTDYPDVEGWPQGFIPIAVHTVDRKSDHVLIAHADCNRMYWLAEMLKNECDEVKNFISRPDVQEVFKKASEKAGGVYNERTLWEIHDAWKIERVHFPERLKECDWYSEELYDKMGEINNKLINFDNGVYEHGPVIINGLDMGVEIQKIRGGSLANDINMHMYLKYDCMNRQHEPKCRWIKNLKYYVYSAHDTTVFAFLSAMGIQSKVVFRGGYPDYTSAVFVELYTDINNNPYFKMLYRESDVNDTIHSVTHFIPECEGKDYCRLDVFNKYAKRAKPDRDMVEAIDLLSNLMFKWCEVDPRGNMGRSTSITAHISEGSAESSASNMVSNLTLAFTLVMYLCSHS